MLTPSTPFAVTCAATAVAVAARFVRPAHMCGLPALKSWRMIETTTFVPAACAAVTMSVSCVEFQAVRSESEAMVPLSLTWRPKKATVDRSEKFQLG
jgi:hypothetical protein